MPPHKLKDLERATFSNIEEQNIDFVQDTLMPWIVSYEQVINWKLIGRNNSRQFYKVNLNGLMRGDAASRAAYYNTRFNMGTLSINEIRAFEDENGIGADGDKYFMQTSMATIDNIIEPPEPPAPVMPPAAPGDGESDPPAPDDMENLQRFRPLVVDAVGKIVHNINERVEQRQKKGNKGPIGDIIDSVVKDRRAYIENTIEPLALSIIGNIKGTKNILVDLISLRIVEKHALSDELLNFHLTSEFLEVCASITKTDTGDA